MGGGGIGDGGTGGGSGGKGQAAPIPVPTRVTIPLAAHSLGSAPHRLVLLDTMSCARADMPPAAAQAAGRVEPRALKATSRRVSAERVLHDEGRLEVNLLLLRLRSTSRLREDQAAGIGPVRALLWKESRVSVVIHWTLGGRGPERVR